MKIPTLKKKIKIVFTGGGTAGHISPIIAITRELQKLSEDDNFAFYYIGPKDEFSKLLDSEEDFKIKTILAGKIRRYFSLQNVVDVGFKVPFGFFQSTVLLLSIRPKLVFSKGGPGSLVVVVAAAMLGIPILLHESDSIPGMSSKVASGWAKKIFTSFEKTQQLEPSKMVLTGNPIKIQLLQTGHATQKPLPINYTKPVIMFFGGSQGAQPLNTFVLKILQPLLKEYEVVHICGSKNYKEIQAASHALLDKNMQMYYHVYGFLDEVKMQQAYGAASLIVSRAGSGSIFEIAAFGKPSILIPLPSSAQNHQMENAKQYIASGAAIAIEQNTLTPDFFLKILKSLFSNPSGMEKMGQAALRFAKPLAAETIAREILKELKIHAN